jgi:diacylglycerol kinase family enzyme
MPEKKSNKAIIFLNPVCNYGKGLSLWKKVKEKIQGQLGESEVAAIPSTEDISRPVREWYQEGARFFIAAGGDGTVNLMVNTLLKTIEDPRQVMLGAIGLGSSNDYHKPFQKEAFIDTVPVKIDSTHTRLRDVIRIDYPDSFGESQSRFCLINASIGITAEANASANQRPPFIRLLHRISPDLAITVLAMKTIFTYKDIPCQFISNGGDKQHVRVSNLGIIKNPHFAGSLVYDTPIEPDDGKLGINLCWELSRFERIALLMALYRRHFKGRKKTQSWLATQFRIESQKTFALEIDGEVVLTNRACFTLLPGKVRCCQ